MERGKGMKKGRTGGKGRGGRRGEGMGWNGLFGLVPRIFPNVVAPMYPVGFWAEPQPKSNWVHFGLKI